jgi:GT2 family glycosyltransferase
MQKASSEIVAMIDSDVILTEGWYNTLIKHFKNPMVAASIGTCIYGYGCPPIECLWNHWMTSEKVIWGCHNIMFRREVVLDIGNFDVSIRGAGEDYDLYRRLIDAGYEYVWDKEAVVYHPLNMGEFLHHWRWWIQSPPYIKKYILETKNQSLLKIYRRSIMSAIRNGIIYCIRVHPTMLLYFPLLKMIQIMTLEAEVRKLITRRSI